MKKGFALIGAGLFGERHAQAYQRHPLVDFKYVCDLNEARAKQVAETYGAAAYTTDYNEVLADPDVIAVSIATPDPAHRAATVAAAEAGKHILVEKPLATNIEDAEAMIAATKMAGVKLMVDFHNRANPPMVAARDAIARGDIGKPSYVYARLSNTVAVPRDMLKWSSDSSALWFLGSHMIDVVGWMLNDKPVRAYVVSRDGILKEMGVNAPDFHVATIEYESGTVGVFEHAWILPETYNTVKDLKVELLGSRGAINIDGSHNRTMELYTQQKGAFADMLVPPFGPHLTGFVLDAVVHFVEAVLFDKPVLATGEDGLANTRIISALIEAARLRQPLELSV